MKLLTYGKSDNFSFPELVTSSPSSELDNEALGDWNVANEQNSLYPSNNAKNLPFDSQLHNTSKTVQNR